MTCSLLTTAYRLPYTTPMIDKNLQNFEKIAQRVVDALSSNQPVELKPGEVTLEAFREALATASRELRRRSRAGKPRLPADTATDSALKARQYRETGSYKGWENLRAGKV